MIELSVNGRVLSKWKNIQIKKMITAPIAQFSLASRINDGRSLVNNYDRCSIRFNGANILDGFIDGVSPFFNERESGVKYTGRDLASILVDSSVTGPFSFKDLNLIQIAQRLVKDYNFISIDGTSSEVFQSYAFNPGVRPRMSIDDLSCQFRANYRKSKLESDTFKSRK